LTALNGDKYGNVNFDSGLDDADDVKEKHDNSRNKTFSSRDDVNNPHSI
jgi:hypothetical protein